MEIRIPKRAFNKVYLPLLHQDKARYLVLYGGAGSGKSVFAAQRLIYRMLTRAQCNILVVRKVGDSNRHSTYALFKQMLSRWGLYQMFTLTDLRIVCIPTGNECIFKGIDDPEKIKSVTFAHGELTDIWVEEASELSEQEFNQLDLRLRGRGVHGQITLTFNPIHALHWLKKRFFDRHEPRAVVVHTTYRDNAFLDPDYRRTLEEYRTVDPYYYEVYCLGQWGVTGHSIFPAQAISQRMRSLPSPVMRGSFTYRTRYDAARQRVLIDDDSIVFDPQGEPYITLYTLPRTGVPYVIGGDTSGEGSDWFVGQVLDNTTGQQVAVLRHQFDEDLYAAQMYCLGRYYHDALIGIEVNFSAYPVRRLAQLGYPRQYVRQVEDSYTHRPTEHYGFRTTALTRPMIIAELVRVLREQIELVCDPITLGELLTFTRNTQGRAEAQAGAHDDCVMALAIAFHVRTQQRTHCITPPAARVRWQPDQWEDYERASPDERSVLLKKWGNPF